MTERLPGRYVATTVPKRELVRILLETVSEDVVRQSLRIEPGTSLSKRLQGFPKASLLRVLTLSDAGIAALGKVEQSYPLERSPTLYLVTLQSRPDFADLIRVTRDLAQRGIEAGLALDPEAPVRRVYNLSEARVFEDMGDFIEVPVVYERRIEYTEADATSEDFGERKVLYALERALVWIPGGSRHGLIACSDYVAVASLITYGRSKFTFRWALPNLTEEMLKRLSASAPARSATFSALEPQRVEFVDVKTLTMYDPSLAESDAFRRLSQDKEREQTAGFYGTHPDVPLGGLGIARRYGRIWTPARLTREDLARLANNLVAKAEGELDHERSRDLQGFVDYYRNVPINLAGKRITGQLRQIVADLAATLLSANQGKGEIHVSDELVRRLISQRGELPLSVALEFECDNCGEVVARCRHCFLPLEPHLLGETLTFSCGRHPDSVAPFQGLVRCICQAPHDIIDAANHVLILPHPELTSALREFLGVMQGVVSDPRFVINGGVLRLLPKMSPSLAPRYSLGQLQEWRVRANHHLRATAIGNTRERGLKILASIKEKCQRDGGHPSRATCDQCVGQPLTSSRIEAGDVCLPRIFGEAIGRSFDGIHHAHEVADVRYQDVPEGQAGNINVGIHMKSRQRSRAQGLGRSVYAIKGLYTQLCFSSYLAATAKAQLDLIGVSVPNAINPEAIASMEMMTNEMGCSFMVVDEEDWLKVLDAAFERSEVAREHP